MLSGFPAFRRWASLTDRLILSASQDKRRSEWPGEKMKYAIVESGGKQYRAVEGDTIEVDRLSVEAGDKIKLDRVLMVVDGDDVSVGTPYIKGVQINTKVLGHFKGPKIIVFKYSPRKRIRVKRGHRQQYTRLLVDFIGMPGESSKPAKKAEAQPAVVKKKETPVDKKVTEKSVAAKTVGKASTKKAKTAATASKTKKKTAAKKTTKTTAKKTAAKKKSTKTTTSKKKTEKQPAKKQSPAKKAAKIKKSEK